MTYWDYAPSWFDCHPPPCRRAPSPKHFTHQQWLPSPDWFVCHWRSSSPDLVVHHSRSPSPIGDCRYNLQLNRYHSPIQRSRHSKSAFTKNLTYTDFPLQHLLLVITYQWALLPTLQCSLPWTHPQRIHLSLTLWSCQWDFYNSGLLLLSQLWQASTE